MSAWAHVPPLPFTWPYVLLFFGVCMWAFIPEQKILKNAKAGAKRANSPDRGSLKVIIIGGRVAMISAMATANFVPTMMPASSRLPCFWIGIALLLAGSLLRRFCFRVLGSSFTGDVRASADQRVVDRGPYRWLRHPSYTGGLLMFGGIGLTLANWLSLVLAVAATLAIYLYRASVEEQALLAAIGEPYARFMATRKRFIPFLL
jgi:protein-S-isoprenylcysteine O-methyltransferase Ste14